MNPFRTMVTIITLVCLTLATPLAASSSQEKGARSADKTAVNSADNWRQWGGPGGDFQLPARPLASSWGDEGPPLLWSRDLGKGYSAITSDKGVLYTMYRVGDNEIAVALDAATGATRWEYSYAAPTVAEHVIKFGKGPNASPLVLDDSIITLGYTGMLHAISRNEGRVLWSHDLVKEYGGEVLVFGTSASPILHDDKILILVGGEQAGVMAFTPDTGAVAWRSAPTSVSYAAPIVIDVDGQKQVVYYSADAIVGLDAASGKSLWSSPVKNQYSNNCSNPIWGEDNLLWASTQLDGGTRVLRLKRNGESTTVEEVWFDHAINLHWWNTIRVADRVYGSIGGQGSILAAVDVNDGKVHWRQRGFDKVKPLQVGDKTLLLDSDGDLFLTKLNADGIEVLSQHRIFQSGESWTVPTLVGTTLFARDQERILALGLGRAARESGSK